MHSYEMSNNTKRKENNWYLLGLFFEKYDFPFKKDEYSGIQNGNFDQLLDFMIKFYEILTKRT